MRCFGTSPSCAAIKIKKVGTPRRVSYYRQRTLLPAPGTRINAALQILSFSELHHRAARQRGVIGNDGRSAFEHMPGRILLVVGVFGREAINRDDHLIATLCQSRAGPN